VKFEEFNLNFEKVPKTQEIMKFAKVHFKIVPVPQTLRILTKLKD